MGDELLGVLVNSMLPQADRLTRQQLILPQSAGKASFGPYPPTDDSLSDGAELDSKRVGTYSSHSRSTEWVFGHTGRAELALDGQRYTIEKGELGIIQPTMKHLERIHHPNDSFHVIWFCAYTERQRITIHSSSYYGGNRFQLISGAVIEERADLCQFFSRTAEEATNKKKSWDSMIKSMVIHVLVEIIRHIEEKGFGYSTSQQHVSMVDLAKGYIHSHFAQHLTLDEISSAAFLSPNYFSSLFAQATGSTVFDYVNKVRLEEARRLLQETRLPVQEVAKQSGFQTASHFTRTFRQQTGLSPRDFRRKLVSEAILNK
jgi:AraC-like DNA-binding protein